MVRIEAYTLAVIPALHYRLQCSLLHYYTLWLVVESQSIHPSSCACTVPQAASPLHQQSGLAVFNCNHSIHLRNSCGVLCNRLRWTVRGVPRVPWETEGIFDGVSEYKLDRFGKIYEHKVTNVQMRDPPLARSPLSIGMNLIPIPRLQGAPQVHVINFCKNSVIFLPCKC